MKLLNIGLAGVLGGLGVIASSMAAQALDFNFSFNHVITGAPVTGRLYGFQEGSGTLIGLKATVLSSPTMQGVGDYTFRSGDYVVTDGMLTHIDGDAVLSSSQWMSFRNLFQRIYGASERQEDGLAYDFVQAYKPPVISVAATAVPFDFNPTEAAALGVPLFIGLGMLRKKKLSQKSAAKKVAELVS